LFTNELAFLVGQAIYDEAAITLIRMARRETQVARRNRLVVEQARISRRQLFRATGGLQFAARAFQ
jgi:hypothetical protein